MAARPVEVGFVNVSANLTGGVIVVAGIHEGGLNRELVRDGPLAANQVNALGEILRDLMAAIKGGKDTMTIHVDNGRIVEAGGGRSMNAAVAMALDATGGDPQRAALELMRAFVSRSDGGAASTPEAPAPKAPKATTPRRRKKKEPGA